MDARAHFSSKAQNYDNNRSKGILGLLVNKEKKVILDFLSIKKNEEILDAGCGSGFYAKIIKEEGAKPYCIDISQEMINQIKLKKINGAVGDLGNFKLNKKFDKVLCAGALEFTNDPIKVISNLKAHLKNNGKIIILLPRKNLFGYLYKTYHKIHNVNIKLFSEDNIKELYESNNLKLEKSKSVHFFSKVLLLNCS